MVKGCVMKILKSVSFCCKSENEFFHKFKFNIKKRRMAMIQLRKMIHNAGNVWVPSPNGAVGVDECFRVPRPVIINCQPNQGCITWVTVSHLKAIRRTLSWSGLGILQTEPNQYSSLSPINDTSFRLKSRVNCKTKKRKNIIQSKNNYVGKDSHTFSHLDRTHSPR